MTFNVRYATAKDGINQWENRKKDVLNLLKNYSPDIVGFQEMLKLKSLVGTLMKESLKRVILS